MRKNWKFNIIVISCLLGLANTSQAFSFKKLELASITRQIESIQKSLGQDESQQSRLEQELRDRELQLSAMKDEIHKLNQEYAAEQSELAKLKKSQEDYNQKLTTQRESLAQQIRMVYRLGQLQSIKALLNPGNLNTLNRQLYYYHYLNDTRLKLVGEIRATLQTLDENLVAINQHEQNLKNLLQAKQQQQEHELQLQKQRQQVIAKLQLKTQTQRQQLASLQEMLNGYQVPQDLPVDTVPFNQMRGHLSWPLEGRILPVTDLAKANAAPGAVLIDAPEGTPVKAIYPGKVIYANWLRGFGQLVIINHGNGFMSLYARNQSISAHVGDKVKANQVIASLGNSGGFAKNSLYFEIRRNGLPLDATQWCHI